MIKIKKIIQEIMREDMPQIKGKEFPEMLRLFKTYEIPYRILNMKVSDLKSTQNDIIPKKVEAIATDISNGKEMHPLLISSDLYIADGHHRAIAFLKTFGPECIVKVCRIGYPIKELLKLLNHMEGKFNGDK